MPPLQLLVKLWYCDKHLVTSLSGILSKGKLILIPLAVLITWWINIALPSAAGCAAAVGAILIPTLIGAGVHPVMAGSAVLAGTWGTAISPGTSHNPFVAKLAGVDVMTVIMNEATAAIIVSVVVIIALTVISLIKKEDPTDERRVALSSAGNQSGADAFKVNFIKALALLLKIGHVLWGQVQ